MFKFLYPEYFLFLIPIAILVVFLYKNGGMKIAFWPLEDVKKIYGGKAFSYKIYYLLLGIISSLFISIFAHPVRENIQETIQKNGIDIEIVLDVSYSMIAEDLQPNRLEVAKNVITQFIESRLTDRVWIIVFAGKPFKSLPLSFDYSIIKKIVGKIDIETINQNVPTMQWTALWDALLVASDSFTNTDEREKVIILLTDGEANKWIHPEMALKYLKEKSEKIKIYTIGIGWLEKTFITIKNPYGQLQRIEIWWIDEKTLKLIASETGGKYFRATDEKTLENIFSTIWALEKKEIKAIEIKNTEEKTDVFLYILIFFMTLFLLLKWKKKL